MQDKLDLAKELIQQSRRLLYTTQEIMAVLDSNARILNSLLAGLENVVPVDVQVDVVQVDVWALVPKKATHIAKDANGEWYWYTKRPQCENSVMWYLWDGDYDEIFNCPLTCDNWQTSLMERTNA